MKKKLLKRRTPKITKKEESFKTHDLTTLTTNSDSGAEGAVVSDDCPLYIIKKEDSLGGERYELIYKKNFMCIAAHGTLDGVLSSLTTIADHHKHSMDGIVDYIDDGILNSEYKSSPCPTVLLRRKENVNSDYTKDILNAIKKSADKYNTSKPPKSRRGAGVKLVRRG